MGIATKNLQSEENIKRMAAAARPGANVTGIKELTEGLCNVAYDISWEDGTSSILKIASSDRSHNTSNEVALMKAEVKAMKIVKENCSFPVAEVLYYDTSQRLCDGDYFFMEKLPGENLMYLNEAMPVEVRDSLQEELGKIAAELSRVKYDTFGFLGEDDGYDSLYPFVRRLLSNLISDAKQRGIDICYDGDGLLAELEQDRSCFDLVHKASLVHWDMWIGNVFVKEHHVSGIIDWERAMWGEPFMDDRFRAHNRNEAFLRGYGQSSFSKEEKVRLRWYDVILYLTMMIEVFYREFDDMGQYDWAKAQLLKVMEQNFVH